MADQEAIKCKFKSSFDTIFVQIYTWHLQRSCPEKSDKIHSYFPSLDFFFSQYFSFRSLFVGTITFKIFVYTQGGPISDSWTVRSTLDMKYMGNLDFSDTEYSSQQNLVWDPSLPWN